MTATGHDLHVQSIAPGVILLQELNPEYGPERRRLRVIKYRGSQFRGGLHERTIREFVMGADGIRIGEALRNFRGVLTGVPVYEGTNEPLLQTEATE